MADMAAVKLLRRAGTVQHVRVAGTNYQFKGGVATPVPLAVAEVCLEKKNEIGQRLFARVDDEIAKIDSEIAQELGVQFEWKTKWA